MLGDETGGHTGPGWMTHRSGLSATEAGNRALEESLRELDAEVRARAAELERVRARRAAAGTKGTESIASPGVDALSQASTAFNSPAGPSTKGPGRDASCSPLRLAAERPGGADSPRCHAARRGGAEEHGVPSRALTTRLESLRDLGNARLRRTDMSGHDLSYVNLAGADLRYCNLRCANLDRAPLPAWDSGLLEGAQLAGAVGWLPANRDLSNAKFKAADLSGFNLAGFDLSNADLVQTVLSGASLCGANLQGASGGRAITVDVTAICTPSPSSNRTGLWNDLKVGKPVVFANTEAAGIRLSHITLRNFRGPTSVTDNNDCVRSMSLYTAQRETGPWTLVVTLSAAKTSAEQTLPVPPDSPALGEFVQVSVLATYGGEVCVRSLQLHGDAWG